MHLTMDATSNGRMVHEPILLNTPMSHVIVIVVMAGLYYPLFITLVLIITPIIA